LPNQRQRKNCNGLRNLDRLCYADREMFKDAVGAAWRGMPRAVRRWIVRVTHTHFVVSAGGIITDDQGRVLLLKHRFRPGSGWGMPGGFMKTGESPEETLQRELLEEIGLKLDQPKLVMTRSFIEPRQLELVFRCRAAGDAEQLSFEIQKVAWFFPNDLPDELPKDQAQLIKSVLGDGAKSHD